ncbi:MAG: RICIN domain-containing protein [Pyrinomonadaceae bacterium]
MRIILMRRNLLTLILLALLFAAGNTFAQFNPEILYQIVAKHSGMCLAVAGGIRSLGNGDSVVQSGCREEENQKWQIVWVGDGYYKILAKHSGKSLDVFGGITSQGNGSPVKQWDFNGAANQLWKFVPVGDDYYQIVAKHSGKSLDINGGPGAVAEGALAQQWDYVGGANQQWKLSPNPRWAAMTRFNPVTQGFRFANTFKNDLGSGIPSDGLCGGMMYAAMDYFLAGAPIPSIDYRPSIGTTLQTYIYNRQTVMITSNADRFADMIAGVTPRADKRIYFERGLKEDALRELRAKIDTGMPAILALQNADDPLGHSVLAIGYDMGRYRGDLGQYKEELCILVYDPNHPGETRMLVPDVAAQRYVYRERAGQTPDPHAHWLTYFVDTRYRNITAPTISVPNLGGADGLVRELRLTLKTGGDEMMGGNDEVKVTIFIDGRQPLVFENLNNKMRWMSFYDQTICLPLDNAVRVADIRRFEVTKTARLSANGADLWDLDEVTLDAYGGFAGRNQLFHVAGQPVQRFNESLTTFSANIR